MEPVVLSRPAYYLLTGTATLVSAFLIYANSGKPREEYFNQISSLEGRIRQLERRLAAAASSTSNKN